MSANWIFQSDGGIDRVPECEVCGAPLWTGGRLCGLCRQWFEVGPGERVDVVPVEVILHPEDLRD